MTSMNFYPITRVDGAFEDFCLQLLAKSLSIPSLQKYGRRGQRQNGVDIFGRQATGDLFGIQCKAKGEARLLEFAEVRLEAQKAESFRPKLDHFRVVTTAARDAELQSQVQDLSDGYIASGLFSIGVLFFEDLQEILQADSALADVLFPRPNAAGRTSLPEELELAKRWTSAGMAQAALEHLEQFERQSQMNLTTPERAELLTGLAIANLALGKPSIAARKLFEAGTIDPTTALGRNAAALSLFLTGATSEAHDASRELISTFPSSTRARMIYIRSAPSEVAFRELLDSVPVPLRSDPEIALALFERAASPAERAAVAAYVPLALESAPNWAPLLSASAVCKIESVVADAPMTLNGPLIREKDAIHEAVELLSAAVERIPADDPHGLLPTIFLQRALANTLIDDGRAAVRDLERAYELAPKNREIAFAYCEKLADEVSQADQAIKILRSLPEGPEQLRESEAFLLAELLARRAAGDDLVLAAQLMNRILEEGDKSNRSLRLETVTRLCGVYIAQEDRGNAAALVERLRGWGLEPPDYDVVAGEIFRRLGELGEAKRRALDAREALGRSKDWEQIRRVAFLLERLECYEEAFCLLREIVPDDVVLPETHHLLHSARRSGRDAFVLDFCDALYRAALHDQTTRGIEIETLLQYDEYQQARQRLLDHLERFPNDVNVRVRVAWLAVRLGWDDSFISPPSELPSAEAVGSSRLGSEVVDVLRHRSAPESALDYAYGLWRRFRGDQLANRALISTVLMPVSGPLQIDVPARVAAGVAVHYQELGEQATKWIVIEPGADALLEFNEVAESHPLAKALLGRSVGEEFEIPGHRVRTRKAKILELRDRRIFRAQECLSNWEDRFPDEEFLASIRVGTSGEGGSASDFQEFIDVVRADSEARKVPLDLYAAGGIPATCVAGVLSKPIYETVRYLSSQEELGLHCSAGRAGDLEQAIGAIGDAEYLVLDPVAIATIGLGFLDYLVERSPKKIFVTESSLLELEEIARESSLEVRAKAFIGLENGRIRLTEVDDEDRAGLIERVQSLAYKLSTSCEVVGGRDLARVDLSTRQKLSQFVPDSCLQSAAIASYRSCPLWTDDLLISRLYAELGLKVGRVWTEAVAAWEARKQILSGNEEEMVRARLLAMRYQFVSIGPSTLRTALEQAGWRGEDREVVAVTREFGNQRWSEDARKRVLATTLREVWSAAPTEQHATAATSALLVALPRTVATRGFLSEVALTASALLSLWPARSAKLREVVEVFVETGVPEV